MQSIPYLIAQRLLNITVLYVIKRITTSYSDTHNNRAQYYDHALRHHDDEEVLRSPNLTNV